MHLRASVVALALAVLVFCPTGLPGAGNCLYGGKGTKEKQLKVTIKNDSLIKIYCQWNLKEIVRMQSVLQICSGTEWEFDMKKN